MHIYPTALNVNENIVFCATWIQNSVDTAYTIVLLSYVTLVALVIVGLESGLCCIRLFCLLPVGWGSVARRGLVHRECFSFLF